MTSTCLGSFFTGTITAHLTNELGQITTEPASDERIVFSLDSGSLPDGLEMLSDGPVLTIFGTANAVGAYPFVIKADLVKKHPVANQPPVATVVRRYVINIAKVANTSLPAATVGTLYEQQLTVDGPSTGTETWQITSGSLPDGLTLNETTGWIYGTPTTEQTESFIICFTNDL